MRDVNQMFTTCTGERLTIVGVFQAIISLGDYVTSELVNVYVVSNLSIKSEVILGREFINVCLLLKPGLDLMKQVARETTLKRITRL